MFVSLSELTFLSRINADNFDKLVSMGFRKRAVGEALCQANSDLNVALEILRVLPQTQLPGDDLVDAVEDVLFEQGNLQSREQLVSLVRYFNFPFLVMRRFYFQISSFGFSMDAVRKALRDNPGDVAAVMNELLSNDAPPAVQVLLESNPEFRNSIMRIARQLQEHHGNRRRRSKRRSQRESEATSSQSVSVEEEERQEINEDQVAYKQLEEDISHSLHEHLDTTFEEELQALEMLHPLVMPHLK